MDLWIVAAATGAGYVAKYWKNQSKDENAFSQLSFGESSLVSSQSSNHLLNKFALRKKRYEDVFGHGTMEESSSDQSPLDFASVAELASMSGFENENSEEHIGESSKRNKMGDDNGILVCNASGRVGSWRNRSRGKAIFSNGDLIKPLSFAEDCLLAHESSVNPCIAVAMKENKVPKGYHFDATESFCEVSQLPFKSLQMCDTKGGERKSRSSSKMANRELFASKGAPDESFILYLGVFIGIIYSFISNKREVHKLKELLKETQYLVQDLQEELEMKDSLKLKEISNDNVESYTYSNVFSEKTRDESSPKHAMNYTVNFDAEEQYEHKAEESSESMSRIEAELEAELEMLGLDINAEATERFPDEDEIDPEFEEDLAEGELRNEMTSGQSSAWTKPNEEGSDTTVHSGNYTVSAWELRLRLQNVIQTRLEARIKKLEMALQNNHRKLQLEQANGELQFSSNHSSPNIEDESKIATQPLDMDFSKDAINGIF